MQTQTCANKYPDLFNIKQKFHVSLLNKPGVSGCDIVHMS